MKIAPLLRSIGSVATSITLLLGFIEIAHAARWQRVPGETETCVDIDSVRPGPRGLTQYVFVMCELTNLGIRPTQAYDCRALRSGEAQIALMWFDNNTGQWGEPRMVSAQSASARFVCSFGK